MASTPIETLLEGKGFSCEAGGNWISGKVRKLDVLHSEHETYTPAPPGPKRKGTDPSVHIWILEGGRKSLPEADWSRAVLLPVQSGMEGETVKWVAVLGGERRAESHVGMGVVVWPKNRMISRRVSSLVDRERFLLPGHKGIGGHKSVNR